MIVRTDNSSDGYRANPRPAAYGREHELAKVGFRVAEIQWPLFGTEFDLINAPYRPIPASGECWERTFAAHTEK